MDGHRCGNQSEINSGQGKEGTHERIWLVREQGQGCWSSLSKLLKQELEKQTDEAWQRDRERGEVMLEMCSKASDAKGWELVFCQSELCWECTCQLHTSPTESVFSAQLQGEK